MVVRNVPVLIPFSMTRKLFSKQLWLLRVLQRRITSVGTARKDAKSLRGAIDQTDLWRDQARKSPMISNHLVI